MMISTPIDLEQAKDISASFSRGRSFYSFVKRAADIILSFFAMLALILPCLIVCLLIYIDDPGPVLFRQQRVGRDGKLFWLYKFRTMRVAVDPHIPTRFLNNPEQCLTRIGRILRKLSIDELPQFINVMRADMSLVGPRPLIPEEQDIHLARHKNGVYQLRPGLTGLAQIHGRDTVSAEEKVKWDVMYLHSLNFWLDLKILLLTIPKVLGMSGVKEGCQPNAFSDETKEQDTAN